jgi:hypothetical protein
LAKDISAAQGDQMPQNTSRESPEARERQMTRAARSRWIFAVVRRIWWLKDQELTNRPCESISIHASDPDVEIDSANRQRTIKVLTPSLPNALKWPLNFEP